MKRNLLLVFVLLVLSSYNAFSHSPIGIEMETDFENNRISIAVNHPVGSPRSHYIKTIEVIVDAKPPIIKTFQFQKANHQRTTVDIPELDEVSRIVIKAYCNKGGFLSREFTLKRKEER